MCVWRRVGGILTKISILTWKLLGGLTERGFTVDFPQEMKHLESDIHTLKTLHHHRIVAYHDIKRDHSTIKIFMEYMSGVS